MFQIKEMQMSPSYTSPSVPAQLPRVSLPKKVSQVEILIEQLGDLTSWERRKSAALKLGAVGYAGAVPALLDALANDPFWMVRCAVIHALESVGDIRILPQLRLAEMTDTMHTVRSCAANAVERMISFSRTRTLDRG